ncbi:trypsin-like serine protease [Actinoallomurus purpureus]|uniref:trypsin-like serine peptidase n=1 Tax=Actinoallomurus purpureus TaxID=478114 RepID=UPI0020929460|nr:trypsin-like serine protease [Actinoallomurus purpureus]MCO6009893.1 trypsin-like serine protease [Actinoallomurus purpureus]
MHINRRITIATSACTVLAAGCAFALSSGHHSPAAAVAQSVSSDDSRATKSYWTAARMKAATPLDRREAPRPTTYQARTGIPRGTQFTGIPTVGRLFSHSKTGDHYCTASVVYSTKHNLALTAAHCIYSYNASTKTGYYRDKIAFVPQYDAGNAPYGVWSAKSLLVHNGWKARADPDLDFGFIILAKDPATGKNVADVTGSNRLTPNTALPEAVHVVGYPASGTSSNDRAIQCDTTAIHRFKYQLAFDCDGFTGGTSGSPWLWKYDPVKRQGKVVGVLGGYHQGGDTSRRSYSSLLDGDIAGLRDQAEKAG